MGCAVSGDELPAEKVTLPHFGTGQGELEARVTRADVFAEEHPEQRALGGEAVGFSQHNSRLIGVRDVPIESFPGVLGYEGFEQA